MSRDELPEPWRSALEQHRIRSKRGLASKARIAPQTAKRLIDGEGRPSPRTVAAVADALFNGDRNRVWELAGYARQDYGDWQLPPEASQLNPEQRAAVLAVVRAMLPRTDEERGDGDVEREAASMTDDDIEPRVIDVLAARARLRGVSVEEYLADAAARHGRSAGRAAREDQNQAGHENQDPGGIDPA